MEVIYDKSKQRIPIKSWCKDIDIKAWQQAINLSNLPFAFRHIGLMPDTHLGYGMPIGGVIATEKVIIPNAVGSDIGCGMVALKTSLTNITTTILNMILSTIRETIPVGFNHHKKDQDHSLMPKVKHYHNIISQQYDNALRQLGTLGSGNHFIEIQKGSDGYIWIMIHSGSRNLGCKVANYYNKLAIKLNEKWHSSVPKKHELAFLPIDSPEGKAYRSEMEYCVEFAFANRKLMMDRVKEAFIKYFPQIEFSETINIAHNYAAMENHFGKNVMVHRKGATKATKDLIGIIPGSQGTSSYIVKGLGNKESFMSCSHGAGRRMGINEAIKKLNFEEEKKKLDDLGIIHSIKNIDNLGESIGAYKDINEVMNNQKDLVKIKVKLKPLGVVKEEEKIKYGKPSSSRM